MGVSIYNADGTLVEQGLAELNESKPLDLSHHRYQPSLEGDTITAKVANLPGNRTNQTKSALI